jgi:hypothetical protein
MGSIQTGKGKTLEANWEAQSVSQTQKPSLLQVFSDASSFSHGNYNLVQGIEFYLLSLHIM